MFNFKKALTSLSMGVAMLTMLTTTGCGGNNYPPQQSAMVVQAQRQPLYDQPGGQTLQFVLEGGNGTDGCGHPLNYYRIPVDEYGYPTSDYPISGAVYYVQPAPIYFTYYQTFFHAPLFYGPSIRFNFFPGATYYRTAPAAGYRPVYNRTWSAPSSYHTQTYYQNQRINNGNGTHNVVVPQGQQRSLNGTGTRQNFTAPPARQNFTAPPARQNFTAPPARQNFSAPPSRQNFSAPPSRPSFSAPRSATGRR